MSTDLSFLDSEAIGLNLVEAEDRAIFRQRIAYKYRWYAVWAVNEHIGGNFRTRAAAVRALADKYIEVTK